MNDKKKPDSGEEVESWFIDEKISAEKIEDDEIEVHSVPLHDTDLNGVATANDAAIIGTPMEAEDLDSQAENTPEEPTIRKSIMEEAKESADAEDTVDSPEELELSTLPTPDLVAARAENTEDTVFPEKSSISASSGTKFSNLDSAPEYLQEENPLTTAERRYDFISPAKQTEEISEEPELTWEEPEETKQPTPSATSLEETIFEGATVVPTIPSRVTAHLWSLLLTLLLLPPAWYYGLDVAQRMRVGATSPWQGGPLTAMLIVELIGAMICIFLVVFIARFSSLGAFFTGLLLTVAGLFTAFTPHLAAAKLSPVLRALENSDPANSSMIQNLMANIGRLLHLSAESGLFLFIGIILLALGFASHGARRKGRKDYLVKRKVKEFK